MMQTNRRLARSMPENDALVSSRDMRPPSIPNPNRGLLLTLSGPDGSGKTTQARLLASALNAVGVPATVRKYDARRSKQLGHGIARLRREADDRDTLGFEEDVAYLMGADQVNFMWGPSVMGLIDAGRTVIVDRYVWDFLITVRVAFGVSGSGLAHLLDRAPVPDLSILLVVPPDHAARQVIRRTSYSSLHPLESEQVLARKCKAYELLGQSPGIIAVDGTASPRQVHDRIWKAVIHSKALSGRGNVGASLLEQVLSFATS